MGVRRLVLDVVMRKDAFVVACGAEAPQLFPSVSALIAYLTARLARHALTTVSQVATRVGRKCSMRDMGVDVSMDSNAHLYALPIWLVAVW